MPKGKKKTVQKPPKEKKAKKAALSAVTAVLLPAGEAPTALLDASTGALSLGIPAGQKGDKGERGPAGASGERGPRGETGLAGPRDRSVPRVPREREANRARGAKLDLVVNRGPQEQRGNKGSAFATREGRGRTCATSWWQRMARFIT